MATYIGLLRAVNVGGKTVLMATLRDCMERAGFAGIQTLLQSGNMVFENRAATNAKLEAVLEVEAKKRIKLETDFFVRSAAEWEKIIEANPFRTEATNDPGRLILLTLKSAPDAASVKALEAAIPGRERVRVAGAHAYMVYPDGMGTSKLTLKLIEKKLGTRGTARNWNTVRKLMNLAGAQ